MIQESIPSIFSQGTQMCSLFYNPPTTSCPAELIRTYLQEKLPICPSISSSFISPPPHPTSTTAGRREIRRHLPRPTSLSLLFLLLPLSLSLPLSISLSLSSPSPPSPPLLRWSDTRTEHTHITTTRTDAALFSPSLPRFSLSPPRSSDGGAVRELRPTTTSLSLRFQPPFTPFQAPKFNSSLNQQHKQIQIKIPNIKNPNQQLNLGEFK